MPSGEEVSFCAHAAIGGAFACQPSNGNADFSFQPQMTEETHVVDLANADGENMACLKMEAVFEESHVTSKPSLHRVIREHLGIDSSSLRPKTTRPPPTFLNSSIARPKTLVYMNSVESLSNVKQPKVSSDQSKSSRASFATACGAIDDSTGIYLYAFKEDEDNAWQCRQFPRNSGYPEDPATGIAAAALACSLHQTNIKIPIYKFYQGTAMGRPSLIEVVNLQLNGAFAKFGLQGKVEIDKRETINVDDQ